MSSEDRDIDANGDISDEEYDQAPPVRHAVHEDGAVLQEDYENENPTSINEVRLLRFSTLQGTLK